MEVLEFIAQQQASAPAPAESAPSGGGPGGFDPFFLIMIGGLFLFMWLFVLRPQRKEEKRKKEMLAQLKKGDRVVTTSGLIGSVATVKDETITLNVGDGTRLEFLRSAISSVMNESSGAVAAAEKPAEKNGRRK